MSDITYPVRFALDRGFDVSAKLGLHPNSVTIISKSNVGSRPGIGSASTKVSYRLTVGDGYSLTAPGDGYLNPSVVQVSARDIFLSGNVLSDKDMKIGPICYPYTFNGVSGGFDYNIINPTNAGFNAQLYFYIKGPAFPSGAYFERIWSQDDRAWTYTIYVRQTAHIPA